ncbi:hypothetical protein [Polaromonas sp. JS666]|uniref:hypothetical protein n=1 Tax=Polaromonas sp. (strain JS666 / ATCC BAA-500) TaxID=296591 RepID=UPI0000536774|nr:hypothetical protein [Polaromonas sp. JS666]ABE44881.1 hypothetical protein Bpro_2967 [Polaromonas sp. JS666]
MSAPKKSECPSGDGQNAERSSNTVIIPPAQSLGKQYANLRARCALAGVVLHQIENDFGKTVYIVSRWALTRELSDLDAVAAWLDCVTGRNHG